MVAADGMNEKEILKAYPDLEKKNIKGQVPSFL
jgi:uncharacterized protein (DUF433 family)